MRGSPERGSSHTSSLAKCRQTQPDQVVGRSKQWMYAYINWIVRRNKKCQGLFLEFETCVLKLKEHVFDRMWFDTKNNADMKESFRNESVCILFKRMYSYVIQRKVTTDHRFHTTLFRIFHGDFSRILLKLNSSNPMAPSWSHKPVPYLKALSKASIKNKYLAYHKLQFKTRHNDLPTWNFLSQWEVMKPFWTMRHQKYTQCTTFFQSFHQCNVLNFLKYFR